MKTLINEKNICRIFQILAITMFALLFHYSLELTGNTAENFYDENIYFSKISILWSLAEIILAIIILSFIGKLSKWLDSPLRKNIFLGIICLISALISIYWVSAAQAAPWADQERIVNHAMEFNSQNYESLQAGNYLALCPHQLGIVTFLRIIFVFFGAGNHIAFQYFTAATIPLMIFAGCMIVRILSSQNIKAELFYLLFAVTCIPMYIYTPFVYGDLCSVSFSLLAVWGLLSCLQHFSWWKVAGIGLSLGFSIQMRSNLFILMIAMLIVIFVKFFQTKSRHTLCLAIGLIVGVLAFQFLIKGIYASHRDPNAEAIPAYLYVLMGLNDDCQRPGWYNGYHANTFAEYGYHEILVREKARQDLHSYIVTFHNDHSYMFDFFTRKMNAQWNAPMYQCLSMNHDIQRSHSSLVLNIYLEYYGRLRRTIEAYAKLYQLLLYSSILCLLVFLFKKKNLPDISYYTLLIAVLGGFLFSLIWEAKTRYILPYLLMMLPYMAIGLDIMTDWAEKKIHTLIRQR